MRVHYPLLVEVALGQSCQFGLPFGANPQANATLVIVMQVHRRVGASRRRFEVFFGATFVVEVAEGPFDVFAGTEVAGFKIGARTEIQTNFLAANGDFISAFVGRVGHLKVTINGMISFIDNEIALRFCKLAAQGYLPFFGFEFIRFFMVRNAFWFFLFAFTSGALFVLGFGHDEVVLLSIKN